MKVTVEVGPVVVKVDDINLTVRQLLTLLGAAGEVAMSLVAQPEDDKAEVEADKTPLGFSASIERAPEPAPIPYYDDEE